MNGIVEVVNDQVVVSSRQIADNFGKEHKDVLYAIREILTAENSAAKFFIESSYSSRGKTFPEFLMNRDGFSLLVMGFTGGKAMEWKLKYINAFNAMETELRSQHEKTQQSLAYSIERAQAAFSSRTRSPRRSTFRRKERQRTRFRWSKRTLVCQRTHFALSFHQCQ